MAHDAVRTTLSMATMIGAAAKERAGELAGGVLEIPGIGPSALKVLELGGQASGLAEELADLLSANRSAITDVLRAEIGLQLQRVGLTTPDPDESNRAEIDRLKAEIVDLRQALEAASTVAARTNIDTRSRVDPAAAGNSGTPRPPITAATKRAAAQRTSARSAAVKRAPTSKPATRKAATGTTVAKKAAAKKAVSKKTVAKKAVRQKAAVRKPTAEPRDRAAVGRSTAVAQDLATAPGVIPSVQPTSSVTQSREGTGTSYADLEHDA